jgi:hypothetical protein
MFQIFGIFHDFMKKRRPPSQPADQRFPAAVGIIVQSAAGAAGFAEIRLTQMYERTIGFCLFGLHNEGDYMRNEFAGQA